MPILERNATSIFMILGRHVILLLFRVISHRIGIPCKTVSLANLIVITFRNKPKHVSQLICLPYLCVEKNMTHLQLKRTTIFGLWFSCLGVSFYFISHQLFTQFFMLQEYASYSCFIGWGMPIAYFSVVAFPWWVISYMLSADPFVSLILYLYIWFSWTYISHVILGLPTCYLLTCWSFFLYLLYLIFLNLY